MNESVSTPFVLSKNHRDMHLASVSENSRHEKHVLHDVMEMSQTQHDLQQSNAFVRVE